MENSHDLFVQGETPIIARLHEASSARELANAMRGEPERPAPQAISNHAAPQRSDAANEQYRAPPEMEEESALPFIGDVVRYLPGNAITVERRLALDEDLYLADHHFVHAPGIKPLSACFPVMPMTVSLEIMAQVAACLAPGHGLIGFENVTAGRWIALADTDTLALRMEGHVEHVDTLRKTCRISVAVFVEAEAQPSISARLLFGKHYQFGLAFNFEEFVADCHLSAAQIYAQRQLFHGPRFQCLEGTIVSGAQGATAELLVRAPDDLFHSTRRPQLLTDPALMDNVGQLMAIWAMQQHGRVAFPVGLGKLEFYAPSPAPGTRVPIRVAITGNALKMLSADVEIEDGAGNVWLRIKDWKSWQFQWDKRLVDFRRLPTRYLLSDAQQLPTSLPDPVCQRLTAKHVAGFDLTLLARHYLHMDEMAAFAGKSGTPPRQLQWLLGRIAAKDAARVWSARHGGTEEKIHPAAFAIENDAKGQPRVSRWPDNGLPTPMLSIAHCEGQAIAVAHGDPVGIDIEPIVERNTDFLNAISSESERALLEVFSGIGLQEGVTRLWCAKEALGKLMGTGVDEAPQRFEAQGLSADGSFQMRHRSSGRQALVTSMRDGDVMIAFGIAQEYRTWTVHNASD